MNENDFEQLRQHGAALEVEQARVIKEHERTIDALLTAINEAVHIFDRDGGEGQSAWNMRAVLLSALKDKK